MESGDAFVYKDERSFPSRKTSNASDAAVGVVSHDERALETWDAYTFSRLVDKERGEFDAGSSKDNARKRIQQHEDDQFSIYTAS